MIRSVILGTGSCAPSTVVSNADLEQRMDTSDEWISQRTGIRERRIAERGEKWSDFMLPACRAALDMAGVAAEDLDLIIVGTITADMLMPSGACTLQDQLGASRAAAFDLSAACSGFVFGLTVADRFLRADPGLKVLVAGGELVSHRLNWDDRSSAVLFGDGGGAAVLAGSTDDQRGILAARIHSDGSLWQLLYVPGGGSQKPYRDGLEAVEATVHMRGSELFKAAVRSMEQACREVLADAGCSAEDVTLVIPHQANIRIIQTLAGRLQVPMEKVFVNIQRYGNTSAGTIPIALDEAVRGGHVSRGDLLLLPVFGGGLTWGSILLRW